MYISSRSFVNVKGACVGWQYPLNLCKEQVMQHFIAVSAHLSSPNITIAVISYNLSTRRCLVHVFRKMIFWLVCLFLLDTSWKKNDWLDFICGLILWLLRKRTVVVRSEAFVALLLMGTWDCMFSDYAVRSFRSSVKAEPFIAFILV